MKSLSCQFDSNPATHPTRRSSNQCGWHDRL
jgi:hypothetical protein